MSDSRTGEMMQVREAAGHTAQVTRGIGFTQATDLQAGEELLIVGSAVVRQP